MTNILKRLFPEDHAIWRLLGGKPRATTDGKPPIHPDQPGAPGDKLPSGQYSQYWVLPPEERAKGFVRPVRLSYRHVGVKPQHPLRPLTQEESERYAAHGYVAFEEYPADRDPVVGRYWTQADLDNKGCGTVTRMGRELAETYARDPGYYGSTFCCGCGTHLPVAEFVWEGTDEVVGS